MICQFTSRYMRILFTVNEMLFVHGFLGTARQVQGELIEETSIFSGCYNNNNQHRRVEIFSNDFIL